MPALYSYYVGMKKVHQYTIRNVSPRTDQLLRERAVTYGKSMNQAALDALEKGLNLSPEKVVHHDLDDLIGTWVEDAEFDKALRSMKKIDKDMWR